MSTHHLFECPEVTATLDISESKFDLLPRLSLFALNHAFVVNAGFAFFTITINFWGKEMRPIIRESMTRRREGKPEEEFED